MPNRGALCAVYYFRRKVVEHLLFIFNNQIKLLKKWRMYGDDTDIISNHTFATIFIKVVFVVKQNLYQKKNLNNSLFAIGEVTDIMSSLHTYHCFQKHCT